MFLRNDQLWCWTLAPDHTGRERDAVSESPGRENLPRPAARLGRRKLPPLHTPLPPPSRSPRGQPGHRTSVFSSRSLRPTLQPPKPRCCPRRPLAVHSRAVERRPSPEASIGSAVKIPPQRAGATQNKRSGGCGKRLPDGGAGDVWCPLVYCAGSERTRLGESSKERQLRNHPEQERLAS